MSTKTCRCGHPGCWDRTAQTSARGVQTAVRLGQDIDDHEARIASRPLYVAGALAFVILIGLALFAQLGT